VQNSRKKGAEFGKSFAPIFKKALEYIARSPEDKTKKNILRILRIWEERGIYESSLIKDLESSYRKAWDDLHGPDVEDLIDGITTPPGPVSSESGAENNNLGPGNENNKRNKREESSKLSSKKKHSGGHSDGHGHKAKRVRTKKEEFEQALRKRSMEATNTIEEWEIDGVTQIEIKLSPSPYKDPPTEEELISLIKVCKINDHLKNHFDCYFILDYRLY